MPEIILNSEDYLINASFLERVSCKIKDTISNQLKYGGYGVCCKIITL